MQNKTLLNGQFGSLTGGFTLIELLVVVLIIGILTSVALPQYTKSVEKARAVEAMMWMNEWAKAQQEFFMARGEFTWNSDDLYISSPNGNILKNFNVSQERERLKLTRKDKNYRLAIIVIHGDNRDRFDVQRSCTALSNDQIPTCRAITNGRLCSTYVVGTGTSETDWCCSTANCI